MPWYLRRFQNLGWYEKLPDEPLAPIMIVAASLDARLDADLGPAWLEPLDRPAADRDLPASSPQLAESTLSLEPRQRYTPAKSRAPKLSLSWPMS